MKKLLSLVFIFALVFTLVGCNGDTTKAKDEEKQKESKSSVDNESESTTEKEADEVDLADAITPTITDSGYSMIQDGSMYNIEYAVQISNENKENNVKELGLKITLKDKDGKILNENATVITDGVAASDKSMFAGAITYNSQENNGAEPSTVEFEVDKDSVKYQVQKESMHRKLGDIEVKESKQEESSFKVKLENKTDKKQDNISLCIVYKKDGKIVGGDYEMIGSIEKGESIDHELIKFSQLNDFDSFEVFAN